MTDKYCLSKNFIATVRAAFLTTAKKESTRLAKWLSLSKAERAF